MTCAAESQVASELPCSRSPHRDLQSIQLDANEEEVQIGRALDAQRNEASLETAFRKMRMALLGDANGSGSLQSPLRPARDRARAQL